jgi:hypothetical protein
MAMNYQNFASLGVNLNRQKYGPLDISNVFTSAADLKYYLTKGTFTEGVSEYWYKNANEKVVPYPYEGQVLATVIDGAVEVFVLALDAEGNFETREIGAKVEVDGKTIKLNADGKLELVGLPADIAGKTLVPSLVNGELTWAEPDTSTAEGQAQEIEGLKTRATALEATVNGTGEGESRVPGLVEKVAALEAVDNATQAELDAYKEVVTAAIAAGVKEAKDYADENDANTVYDDTALAGRVSAIEADYLKAADKYDDAALVARVKAIEDDYLTEADKYDDTALAGRVTTAEGKIEALETAVEAIDYVDADELTTALEPYSKTADVNTELAKKADKTALEALQSTVDAFLTGTGTEAALDSLKELIAYIDEHDGADLTEMVATIEGIEKKLEGVDTTVVAYVTAAIEALKIGDYAKAADLTALAGRVDALEKKPFDTYATKTEVQNVDAKFADYTTTTNLNTQLAAKADADSVVANDTFETFKGENTTAIGTAKSEAIAVAAKAVEDAGYAVADDVAETYATKTELGEAVEGIENELLAYAKTTDVNTELAKKIETATIVHAVTADPENNIEAVPEGVTKEGTTLKIVVDAPTRAETTQMIADKVAAVTGGESAAAVKLLVEAETERSIAKDDAHDAAIAKLTGEASVVGSVAESKALAQKGVDDAAKVAGDLVTANSSIANNAREIETVKGTITTVNETLSGKITALENKDVEIAGQISALDTTVKGHTASITEQGGKITALENKDIELAALIQGNTDKFAGYYTKDEVDAAVQDAIDQIPDVDFTPYATVATVEAIYKAGEGETAASGILADEIARAKAAEQANANAISVIVGEDKDKTIRAIAAEETAKIVANADAKYDTLKEIADFIINDETGAAAMANDIAGLKNKVDTGDKTVSKYVDDAIAAIPATPVATAEKAGVVKASAEVTVAEDGTLGLGLVSTDRLVQGVDILILDGGNAQV